jgi:Family of unknown function (DUF6352)
VSAWRDFWLSCVHHLLDRDATGNLLVTDEFLMAYLARPELMPLAEACSAERGLHSALLRDPRQPISASRVAAIADADTRENWQTMIAWRDHLVRYCSLEAAYLEIVRRGIKFPHILVCQLVQAILRNALDDCSDVFMLRASEMFFRPQRLVLQEASIVAVDEETNPSPGLHSPSPLATLLGSWPTAEVDLLSDSTAESYWERSDRFDMALDLTTGRRGLIALGNVVARWLSHLLAIDVVVEPLAELQSAPFSWYVGLSSDATRIGDAIWNGDDLDDGARAQLVSLFRLTFRDPADVIENIRGEPLYLLLAMNSEGMLRLKPQNLIAGLPIRQVEAMN